MGQTVFTQWYLLDDAGDAWRPAGDIQRHTRSIATSNDTSWILLETPGDLMEMSRDVPRGSQHPMIPRGFCWRHLETGCSLCKTYVNVRYIQWYLLDSTRAAWRPAGKVQRHTMRFVTSNDTSCILLERPGDLLETSRDIPQGCNIQWYLLDSAGDLLETSRDMPQGSWQPMILPGLCRRHLETCWSLHKTYVDVHYIQWSHLDSAGDGWRLAGDIQRRTTRFATSNDTSWILVETPGDLLETSRDIPWGLWHPMIHPGFHWRHLETCWRDRETYHEVRDIQWYVLDSAGDAWTQIETSRDIPRGSLHPMIPPALPWRHLETCWRHPETYHEVRDIQWYLLDSARDTWRPAGDIQRYTTQFGTYNDTSCDSAGDTWRLAGAITRYMSMFTTSNDTPWTLLETPQDLLETSSDIPQGSVHPMIPPGFHWSDLETRWSLCKTYTMFTTSSDTSWIPLELPGDLLQRSRDIPWHSWPPMTPAAFCWRHWRAAGDVQRHTTRCVTSNDTAWMLLGDTWRPAGDLQRHTTRFVTSNDTSRIQWRHLKTCWRPPETYHNVRDIQWYLLDFTGDTWRLTGAFTWHMSTFATSNDTSWILLETPGDLLEPLQGIHQCSLHPLIPPGFHWSRLETCCRCPETSHKVHDLQWYLLDSVADTWRPGGDIQRHTMRLATSNDTSCILVETLGDLLVTSRDIPQGSQHRMIPPGFCWRHLEPRWSLHNTYINIRYIQWSCLDSAGDTWRPAGDIPRHTTSFTTPTDTSWVPLESPRDSLEPSQDICRHSLHPMRPAGVHWRHLETCWRCPETYHEVHNIQWYCLDSAGDTWRLAGAFARHMSMFATSNDMSWILLETPADSLEPSQEICRHSVHPMIPPGFCWRHLETRWSLRKTYVNVHYIQWYVLDSAEDTWRPAGDVQSDATRFATSNDPSLIPLETWGRCPETYHEVHNIQWYLLYSAGDTWRPAGEVHWHTTRFTTSNDTSWILLETPRDLLDMSRDIPWASRHPVIPPGLHWRFLETRWSLCKTYINVRYIQWYLPDSPGAAWAMVHSDGSRSDWMSNGKGVTLTLEQNQWAVPTPIWAVPPWIMGEPSLRQYSLTVDQMGIL